MKKLIKSFSVGKNKIKITVEECNDRLWVEAIVNNKFNLCDLHYGYIRHAFKRNTRLRSEKSKFNEKITLYNGLKAHIKENFEKYIIEAKTVVVEIKRDFVILEGEIVNLSNLKSIQSNLSISWNYHDVYNDNTEILVRCVRAESGQLQYFVDQNQLYDFKKLKKLRDSEDFKNKNFSFFFYNEVLRLLGENHNNIKAMSGLFAS